MTLQNQTQQLRMGGDYRNHLLEQIELLRCVIFHEELSKRLGDVTERCLARYVAGKTHLREDEFGKIAKALTIDARMLAQAWAAFLGLRPLDKDAVSQMVDRAYRHWKRHSRLAARRVPPSPSPMTVIRAKYADRLPRQTPPLWFNSFRDKKPTREGRQRFVRAYENVGRVRPCTPVTAQCRSNARHQRNTAQLMRRARLHLGEGNLHIRTRTYTVRGTIEGIEKKLDSEQFLRINRSPLIRIDFIRELQKWTHGEYRILLQSGHTLM